jgi:hypothetical protein
MQQSSIIAERSVDMITAAGDRIPFRVEFGPIINDGQDCRCRVRFHGWGHSPPDIRGYDSLQALMLAVGLVHSILDDFVSHGGRIVWPGTKRDYDLDEFSSSPNKPAA